MEKVSGKFVLRLDSKLHHQLKKLASEQDISLNELCINLLSTNSVSHASQSEFNLLIHIILDVFKDAVLGIALFGSFVKGSNFDTSDIDILVLLNSDFKLDRKVYQKWDVEAEKQGLSHRLQVTFCVAPISEAILPTLLAEVAIDGIILWERNFRFSKYLIQIREKVATGRLKRKFVHGQPYWIESKEQEIA